MRGRFVLGALLGVLAALVAVSFALASPPAGKGRPEGKGKKPATGVGCRPAVQVVLKGTIAGAPGTGSVLAVTAKSGNAHARAYVTGTQPVTVQLGPGTKVRRQGQKSASALLVGDRVLVQARVCKADLAGGGRPALTATKVIAQSSSGAAKQDDAKQKGDKQKDDDQDDD